MNLEEAVQESLDAYRTLGDFFQRELKPTVRQIDSKSPLVSSRASLCITWIRQEPVFGLFSCVYDLRYDCYITAYDRQHILQNRSIVNPLLVNHSFKRQVVKTHYTLRLYHVMVESCTTENVRTV